MLAESGKIGHVGADAAVTLHHYMTLAQPVLDQYGYLAVFGAVLVEGFGIPSVWRTAFFYRKKVCLSPY